MELYAAGCNAWANLDFSTAPVPADVENLHRFTKVLAGRNIESIVSRLSHTIIKIDDKFRIAGHMPDPNMAKSAATMALAANGDGIYLHQDQPYLTLSKRDRGGKIVEESCPVGRRVIQTSAFDTAFLIRYDDGTVATMGDARFPDVLGRVPTEQEPADKFCVLEDLVGLDDPATHITASGYTGAVLTKSGSVYAWGRQPPSQNRQAPIFPDLLGFPNYIDIDQKDIMGFALGDAHAIALTTDRQIYVSGSNQSDQLGLGNIQHTQDWRRLDFEPPEGLVISGVAAGPKASFILVSGQCTG